MHDAPSLLCLHKKRKQKSLHDLLSYMQMLEDGISFSHIHKNYGINEARLKVLWSRYQKESPLRLFSEGRRALLFWRESV